MKLPTIAAISLSFGCLLGLPMQAKSDGVLAADAPDLKHCSDVSGLIVQPGMSYTPGPDYCTVCKCEDGSPKFCRAVLCQPRPDCTSFRVGTTCCDFICLDDMLPNRPGLNPIGRLPDGTHYPSGGNGIIPHIHENGENSLGMRLAAAILTALMAFVLLLFLVHRLRQRRITAQQYVNAQDVACCHPAAYWHNNDQAHLFLQSPHWKPPSCIIDAPPPYTEADAQRAARSAAFAPGALSSVPSSAPPSYSGPAPPNLQLLNDNRAVNPVSSATAFSVNSLNRRVDAVSRDSPSALATRRDSEGGAGGSGLPPASLGPLAVQLLPAAANSAELREQIQRQRRNLTDHSTRSLPRHHKPPDAGGVQLSVAPDHSGSKGVRTTLTRPSTENDQVIQNSKSTVLNTENLTLPRSSVACGVVATIDNQSITGEVVEVDLVRGSASNQDEGLDLSSANSNIGNEEHADEDENEQNKLSVRKSVLKFEAATAARETPDSSCVRSSSPAAPPSPSRAAASSFAPRDAPQKCSPCSMRGNVTNKPILARCHQAESKQNNHKYPPCSPSSVQHESFTFLGGPHQPTFNAAGDVNPADVSFSDNSFDGYDCDHAEAPRLYPCYSGLHVCSRQPLLPQDQLPASPDVLGKLSRRRRNSVDRNGAACEERVFSSSNGNGSVTIHYTTQPNFNKSKNQLHELHVDGVSDSEVTFRAEQIDRHGADCDQHGEPSERKSATVRAVGDSKSVTVNCASGARNKM
ncbi:uncharacterized protein LOC108676009 [Hyalella azteca]|uniref:Uncharacterized protein LOC108676009 n=1 Tax=Hyalella azteca TaxID=294128 RepID=A0A8B7P0K3_HYAAZ|nr:uncharacterized protein LOC108676009 [Hyalella azteca]